MDNIYFISLLFNFAIYICLLIPPTIYSINKKVFKNKTNFFVSLCSATLLETFFSLVLYVNSHQIFSFFTNVQGIINTSYYISRIVFSTSSFYALKIFTPALMMNRKRNIRPYLFFNVILSISFMAIGYLVRGFSGFLIAIPISDIVGYILDIYIIIKTVLKN